MENLALCNENTQKGGKSRRILRVSTEKDLGHWCDKVKLQEGGIYYRQEGEKPLQVKKPWVENSGDRMGKAERIIFIK